MKGLKRLAALILTLCLLATMLPVIVSAESELPLSEVVAAEKEKAAAALTAPQNPNQIPLNAGALARSSSSNYAILRNHINNNGVTDEDGYVRIIEWLETDDGSEYYFSAINEPSGIKFQYLSLHTDTIDCGVLLEFVLTSSSRYVSADGVVEYYYNGELMDSVSQIVSVSIGSYTTETVLPFNNSSYYITSGAFSDIMNSAMRVLCQYWDLYCDEYLGFGLNGLGFHSFVGLCNHTYDNDCDTTCNKCGETRSVSHTYGGSCDTTCNICGATRYTDYSHSYSTSCDAKCNYCGDIRTSNSKHTFAGNIYCQLCYATFGDVSSDSWQFAPVLYTYENDLMTGKGSNINGDIKFDPNSRLTREEFVQVLYNAEGRPYVDIYNKFPDVKNDWYKNAVLWANDVGVVMGMGNGKFGVGMKITRQDLAVMLYRYAQMKGYSLNAEEGRIDVFADGNLVSDYAKNGMNWAVTNGILGGKGTAGQPISTFRLDPLGNATRAECAVMLKNFMTTFGNSDNTDVMTHDEYMAADEGELVTIEAYVQATQEWWEDTIVIYAQGYDGGYFVYNAACSREMAAQLVPGTKIRVTGYKSVWMGQHEILEGQIQIINDGDTYIADPVDVTGLLESSSLMDYQSMLVSFRGMKIEKIEYKNDEPGDDIYITASRHGISYEFCVEVYLTGTDSDVYTTVQSLRVGDIVYIEGFLYWYEGLWPHITSITKM